MSGGQPGRAAETLAAEALAVVGAIPSAAPFLEGRPAQFTATRDNPPSGLPVLHWLADATRHTVPATATLVAALAAEADALAWRQSYAAADFGPAFLERYGWTELIGLRGPIACETLALGLLMLGPDILYPAHAHAAEELYLPLAGTAFWQSGDAPERPVQPGTPVHHSSWMRHATRTGPEPLVALYLWRGVGLDAKPRITSPG